MEEILPLNLSAYNRRIIDQEAGPDTKILITGYADLAVTQPPSNTFTRMCSGLVLFSKDRRRRNFYIQAIDFIQEKRVLDLKVSCALRYERNPQYPVAHTISEEGNGTSQATGLIFKDSFKADQFFRGVTERIAHLRTKRDARVTRVGAPPVAVADAPGGLGARNFALAEDQPAPSARKISEPSLPKKHSITQNRFDKIPDLAPPNPDEKPRIEGTSNGLFVRNKKILKKQTNDASAGGQRANPRIAEKPHSQLQSKEPKMPPRFKPLPSLPNEKKCTSSSSSPSPSPSPSSSSAHSPMFPPRQPLMPPSCTWSPSSSDNTSSPPPRPKKSPAHVDRGSEAAPSRASPIFMEISPTSPKQFDPSEVLEYKKRDAKLPKQPKFLPATTDAPAVSRPKAHGSTHLQRSTSHVDGTMKTSKAGFPRMNLDLQRPLSQETVRNTESPPPPPPPPQPPMDAVVNGSLASDRTAPNEELDFPPPPPMVLANHENVSPFGLVSNFNSGSNSPRCGLQPKENRVQSPTLSDVRGSLMAALQNDNPTARLRKKSLQNLARAEEPPAPSSNLLAMMAQSLQVRRHAIDPIYLLSSESDSDDDEWSA